MERGFDGLSQLRIVELRQRGRRKNISQIPGAARLTTRIPPRVGMQLLCNLCRQTVAAYSCRCDVCKREEVWRREHVRGFKDRITVSNIQMEVLKLATVE
jgi:hypothetical protein